MIQSSYDLQSGCPGFRSGGFYPPPCFVKFIGFTLAVSTGFKKGSMYLMEGIRFHLCASPLFHACAEGLVVADEFHVPLSFRLAAAIVPRRRERSARHQFSPLGTASYVQKPEPQCHIRCPPSTVNKQPSSVSHPPSERISDTEMNRVTVVADPMGGSEPSAAGRSCRIMQLEARIDSQEYEIQIHPQPDTPVRRETARYSRFASSFTSPVWLGITNESSRGLNPGPSVRTCQPRMLLAPPA